MGQLIFRFRLIFNGFIVPRKIDPHRARARVVSKELPSKRNDDRTMVKGIPRLRFLLTGASLETVLSAESGIELTRTCLVIELLYCHRPDSFQPTFSSFRHDDLRIQHSRGIIGAYLILTYLTSGKLKTPPVKNLYR